MAPPPARRKNPAFRFVSSEASQISSVVEIMLAGKKFAALFTKISNRPNSFPAFSNSARISATFRKSAEMATARRPIFSISVTVSCASA